METVIYNTASSGGKHGNNAASSSSRAAQSGSLTGSVSTTGTHLEKYRTLVDKIVKTLRSDKAKIRELLDNQLTPKAFVERELKLIRELLESQLTPKSFVEGELKGCYNP
jgi:hypothetical protein